MALTIRNAILHILHNDGPSSVFSQTELDIDSEICEAFITKHVKKLLDNPAVRTATFKPDAALYQLLIDYQNGAAYFKDTAIAIAQKLDALMTRFTALPPCDLLIARVGNKHGEYLAVLQLGFQEVYAHHSTASDNQLTMYKALPFASGKVEYACLIALDGPSMPISLVEKSAVLDGNNVLYFSELFLECETAPSKKEQAQLIEEVNTEIVETYFKSDPNITARIKSALVEEVEDSEGFVSMDSVAAQVFADNEEVKTHYLSTLREAGIQADLPLGERVVRQQFGTQRIKGENGVEIKFPAQLASEEDEMEITHHGDGTVTVLIKRLRVV